MSLLAYLIVLAASGLVVGGLARLALPGPDPMTLFQTIALGLAGNFVAGIIVWLLWAHRLPGLVLSVACSSVAWPSAAGPSAVWPSVTASCGSERCATRSSVRCGQAHQAHPDGHRVGAERVARARPPVRDQRKHWPASFSRRRRKGRSEREISAVAR